ncbi:hypothetical protein FQZ97_1087850 [compost metagenome]
MLQAAQRIFTRQVAGIGVLCLPVRQLLIQCAGMFLQMTGPALVSAGFVGQGCGTASGQLGVGLLEVFEQHPPRHAVHRQMVHSQQ